MTANDPTEISPQELDLLMDEDPLKLSARKIDQIIYYMRLSRARAEAGIKPKRTEGEGPKIDLVAMGMIKKAPNIKRRSLR